MNQILEIMINFRHASLLYERAFVHIREKYRMTQLEIDILGFLKNNPATDTASDIVQYRMLPKANVSQAVELLIQKEMISRRTDTRDRRRIHLKLEQRSEEVLEAILKAQKDFGEQLFHNIPEEMRRQYMETTYQISQNVKYGLECDKNGKK